MKNINDKTKKWLSIAGLGIVCVALVIAISFQFKIKTSTDDRTAPASAATGEINPSANMGDKVGEKGVVIPASESIDDTAAQTDQLVQNLQPAVTKPAEPTESQKTDPSQKPSGEKVEKQTSEPKGGEKKDGQVYLPGFGWVSETGGSGTTADDMYENGNKIGIMD